MGKPLIDLTGQRFGKLTAIEKVGYDGKSLWKCACDCGGECIVRSPHLRNGRQVSCGCHKAEVSRQRMTKHGHAARGNVSNTYRVWSNMMARCQKPAHSHWKHYGGRGIQVCGNWQKFDGFLADMGEAPDGLTLDRIDVNGDYCPDNCRWADWATQMRNKTNNVWVEVDGQRMVREDAKALLGLSNYRANRLPRAKAA